MQILRKISKWVGWIAVLVVVWIFFAPALELLKVVQDREKIIAEVGEFGIWAPIILVAAITLQLIIAMVPGHLLGVAAGYLYGFWYGALLSWTTVVIGGQILFYLARKYGKPFVYRVVSENVITKWENLAKRQGIVFFVFSFSLPIFPADAMIYVAGLANISARDFFIAQVVGRVPGVAVMSLAGAYGFEMSTQWLIFILVLSALMFAAWWKYGLAIEEKIVRQRAAG